MLVFCVGLVNEVELTFLCFRIQNMRMIDGKPEYKNGLVSGFVDLCVCVCVLILS